jgi:hypothetical protein
MSTIATKMPRLAKVHQSRGVHNMAGTTMGTTMPSARAGAVFVPPIRCRAHRKQRFKDGSSSAGPGLNKSSTIGPSHCTRLPVRLSLDWSKKSRSITSLAGTTPLSLSVSAAFPFIRGRLTRRALCGDVLVTRTRRSRDGIVTRGMTDSCAHKLTVS